jgi:hypothetical protein
MGHHSVAVADVPPEGNHIENMEYDTEVSAHTDVDMKIFNTEEKRHMAVVDPSLFPDGGLRAWSVVAASFLLVFCTFGTTP